MNESESESSSTSNELEPEVNRIHELELIAEQMPLMVENLRLSAQKAELQAQRIVQLETILQVRDEAAERQLARIVEMQVRIDRQASMIVGQETEIGNFQAAERDWIVDNVQERARSSMLEDRVSESRDPWLGEKVGVLGWV